MRAILQPSPLTFSIKNTSPSLSRRTYFLKPFSIRASSTSLDYNSTSTASKQSTPSNYWKWKFMDNSVNIYYEEHTNETKNTEQHQPTKNLLLLPTISDVSTVEEWRAVAKEIVGRDENVNYKATVVDWPGLGYSDRPKLDYTADVMEKFLVDLVNSPDSPISSGNSGLFLVNFTGFGTVICLISFY